MESLKSTFQSEVIDKIKNLRENNKVSQALIADIIKKSYGLIGNIESKKFPQKYTLEELFVLCKYFEYPFYKLFINEEDIELDKEKLLELLTKKIIKYDSKRKNH